jgi:hypothetical protein
LDLGTYKYNATAYDGAGNSNSTETRTITITAPGDVPEFGMIGMLLVLIFAGSGILVMKRPFG